MNHDGCLDVADAQLIAAHYSPAGALAGPALAALGATFTVNSSADADDAQPGDGVCATSGTVCTLRAALTEANLATGANTIAFAIPGTGVHTIALATPLPTLSDESGPTMIDGYSQPGAQPNSHAADRQRHDSDPAHDHQCDHAIDDRGVACHLGRQQSSRDWRSTAFAARSLCSARRAE